MYHLVIFCMTIASIFLLQREEVTKDQQHPEE